MPLIKLRGRLVRCSILAVAALVGIFCAWAFWWEPSSLTLLDECVAVEWPFERPLRIAVLADLHTGSPYNGISKLTEIVRRTNAAGPDLVFILGDLVIQGVLGASFVPPEEIAGKLGELKSSAGTFAVLGNHDVWFGAERVKRALTDARIEVLEDRAIQVQTPSGSVWLAGVSDFWTERHDVKAALAAVVDSAPVILLTHNPDVFPEIPRTVHLTVAGHTHGGQVFLPLFGRPIVPSQYGQRFAAGHIVEDGRRLYVATGIGTSILPIRFRVPPSILC